MLHLTSCRDMVPGTEGMVMFDMVLILAAISDEAISKNKMFESLLMASMNVFESTMSAPWCTAALA
jgi:hypothetical protein